MIDFYCHQADQATFHAIRQSERFSASPAGRAFYFPENVMEKTSEEHDKRIDYFSLEYSY